MIANEEEERNKKKKKEKKDTKEKKKGRKGKMKVKNLVFQKREFLVLWLRPALIRETMSRLMRRRPFVSPETALPTDGSATSLRGSTTGGHLSVVSRHHLDGVRLQQLGCFTGSFMYVTAVGFRSSK